jgi:hypothetical protein
MARILRDALNEANPNKIASALQELQCGSAFGAVPVWFKDSVTANVMSLPVKAAFGLVAYATAGTDTGVKTYTTGAVAPAPGTFVINGQGNAVFFGADAVTAAEIFYVPVQGEVFEETVPVTSSIASFTGSRGSVLLLSAEVVDGLVPGSKVISRRGDAAKPGAAALSVAGTTVVFEATDVVNGLARLRYVVTPNTGGTTSILYNLESETNI